MEVAQRVVDFENVGSLGAEPVQVNLVDCGSGLS